MASIRSTVLINPTDRILVELGHRLRLATQLGMFFADEGDVFWPTGTASGLVRGVVDRAEVAVSDGLIQYITSTKKLIFTRSYTNAALFDLRETYAVDIVYDDGRCAVVQFDHDASTADSADLAEFIDDETADRDCGDSDDDAGAATASRPSSLGPVHDVYSVGAPRPVTVDTTTAHIDIDRSGAAGAASGDASSGLDPGSPADRFFRLSSLDAASPRHLCSWFAITSTPGKVQMVAVIHAHMVTALHDYRLIGSAWMRGITPRDNGRSAALSDAGLLRLGRAIGAITGGDVRSDVGADLTLRVIGVILTHGGNIGRVETFCSKHVRGE